MILFSVIIPSYKTTKEVVVRSIDSVLHQSCDDYELIVVDDNDDDEFKKWNIELKDYYSNIEKVRFVFHECNKGANYARNTGIKESLGEFVAFLDSDDEWDYRFLEVVKHNIVCTNKDLFSSNYRLVRKSGICKPVFSPQKQKSGYIFLNEIFEDLLGPTSTVCVRKSAIIDSGLFDVRLPARQDYDMWLRICKSHECVFIFEPLVKFYKDGHESISSSSQRYIKGTIMVLDKILKDRDVPNGLHRKIKAAHYKQIAHACITTGDYNICREYIKLSFKNNASWGIICWYFLSYFPTFFSYLKMLKEKRDTIS